MEFVSLFCISFVIFSGCALDFRENTFSSTHPPQIRLISNTTSLFNTLLDGLIDCIMYCYKHNDCEFVFFSHQEESCEGFSFEQLQGSSYIEDNINGIHAFQRSESECSRFGYFYFGNLSMCFRFENTEVIWDEARELCLNDGADLVILETDDTLNLFIDFLQLYNGPMGRIHVGAKYNTTEGEWKWMNGHVVSNNQTSFSGPNQPCIGLKSSIRSLIDTRCDAALKVVCAKMLP